MDCWFMEEKLRECRRVFFRRLQVEADIGVFDFEKEKKQPLVMNISAFVYKEKSKSSRDCIEDVLDYNFVRQVVINTINGGHFDLQETLVDRVAKNLLRHPLIEAVAISSEKTEAYGNVDGVGVEIFEFKAKK